MKYSKVESIFFSTSDLKQLRFTLISYKIFQIGNTWKDIAFIIRERVYNEHEADDIDVFDVQV